MPEVLRTPPDRLIRLVQLSEEVRIIKLNLSGLQDPSLKDVLPGAARIATETCVLLDKLLREAQG